DISKAVSLEWRSLSTEERQYWEHLAREKLGAKKKLKARPYPHYVYRPGRFRNKEGR
ncbi:hypothetical protein K435DRAFT_555568, partial [Dendrothele bispora CBS 962.96]